MATESEILESKTKEDRVADFLREGIISGRFARGTRLKQAEIAKLLNTSITPVREALKLLEAEGYVTGSSYRSATVVPFDLAASTEILNLRILLETQLVQGAMDKISTADLDDLRRLATEFELVAKRNEGGPARGANYRFHHRLYVIANLPQTLHFVQILWSRYAFDVINQIVGRMDRAIAEHAELVRNMMEGDTAGAILSTRRHIESGWAELRDALDQYPNVASSRAESVLPSAADETRPPSGARYSQPI
jgi:DNA-binding GntR family transcriptional regulator